MVSQTARKISGLIRSKHASSFFINGPPGSGKSFLLKELSQQLPTQLPGLTNVFGPYKITDFDQPWSGQPILASLSQEGYLINDPSECMCRDLASTWKWAENKCQIPRQQSFIVLVDLPYLSEDNLTVYCDFLSNVRSIEAARQNEQVRLCHVVAGFWDTEKLQQYAQRTGVSFPYTEGDNYCYWWGISLSEMSPFFQRYVPESNYYPVMEQVLFELTGGNPALAIRILSSLADSTPSFSNLVAATQQVARRNEALLTQSTLYLDEKSKSLLCDLLIQQYLPGRQYAPYRNRLLGTGLVKEEILGQEMYIRFRSWFYELLVRLHGDKIGIPQYDVGKIRIPELMPLVHSLNLELYRLISDIETQARNFVTIQLSLQRSPNEPLLQGFSKELKNGFLTDAQDRAKEWRRQVKKKKVAYNDLNPISSYLTTGGLANIISDLAYKYHVKEWDKIAQAIGEMAEIRNAVMHNQLVNDSAIGHLYQLQNQIYASLKLAQENHKSHQ